MERCEVASPKQADCSSRLVDNNEVDAVWDEFETLDLKCVWASFDEIASKVSIRTLKETTDVSERCIGQ